MLSGDFVSVLCEFIALLFEFHVKRKLLYIISRNIQLANPENVIINYTASKLIAECYHTGIPLFCELALDFIPERTSTSYCEVLLPY